MFAVDEILNHGDEIQLTNCLTKEIEPDGQATYFSAVCEGDVSDAEPHTVIVKNGITTPQKVEFPDNTVVLGLSTNKNRTGNCSIFYAVPQSQYGFDVGVDK